MPCMGCGRGFHEECDTHCDECHPLIIHNLFEGEALSSSTRNENGYKSDDKVTDYYSTGRKRAALLYPINKEDPAPCEWRGKKNCRGGLASTGCNNGFQQYRHHGPDKTPINNAVGNVHQICKKCHKRWHFTNDAVYVKEEYIKTAHEPQEATIEELQEYERKWMVQPRGHLGRPDAAD